MDDKINILFLDIDGVLNHAPPGDDLYYDNFLDQTVPICNDNLNNLKYIIKTVPSLRIVWSTDWRLCNDVKWNMWLNPRLVLEKMDFLKNIIIGNTPKRFSSNRFEEIHLWMVENERKYNIDKFLILDDFTCGSEWYNKNSSICDPSVGLTLEQSNKIIEYYNNDKR